MYTELMIDKHGEEPLPGRSLTSQSNSLIVKTFDLCKNMRYNFRIPVRNEPGPLRFRFEYLDISRVDSGEVLKRDKLLDLKGFMDVFLSKTTDNPDLVREEIAEASN